MSDLHGFRLSLRLMLSTPDPGASSRVTFREHALIMCSVSQSDAELIARTARGDSTAAQLLYERHWSAVYRFAWLLTSSVADAEDITQECFVALIRQAAGFDARRAQLRTWLIAITRNQWRARCRDRIRDGDGVDL